MPCGQSLLGASKKTREDKGASANGLENSYWACDPNSYVTSLAQPHFQTNENEPGLSKKKKITTIIAEIKRV